MSINIYGDYISSHNHHLNSQYDFEDLWLRTEILNRSGGGSLSHRQKQYLKLPELSLSM